MCIRFKNKVITDAQEQCPWHGQDEKVEEKNKSFFESL